MGRPAYTHEHTTTHTHADSNLVVAAACCSYCVVVVVVVPFPSLIRSHHFVFTVESNVNFQRKTKNNGNEIGLARDELLICIVDL